MLLLLALSSSVPAAQLDATWNGGNGSWFVASNWSGGAVPNNGGGNTYRVFIDGGNGAASTVTLDSSAGIDELTIDGDDRLDFNDDRDLSIIGGPVTNSGTIGLNSVGSLTDLNFTGAVTVFGSGSIVMSSHANNRILSNNNVITHEAGHTIRGAGQLLGNTGGMINQGSILADQSAALTIDPNGLGFTNQGTMEATGAGGLTLASGSYTNTGFTIEAGDGSRLTLVNAAVTGGLLSSDGSGLIDLINAPTLTDVGTSGSVRQLDDRDATVIGSLLNDATWTLNSNGSLTDLGFSGPVTVSGSGSIVMSGHANNRILSNNEVITHETGHGISGAGQLLANTGGMINRGSILADQNTALTIDPNGLGFTNEGTMQATGAGGLTLAPGAFTNTGSTIQAGNGSRLTISGASVTGGTLTGSGTGLIDLQNAPTLIGLTTNGTVQQIDDRDATVQGSLTNNATWTLNSSGSLTDLSFSGGVAVSGTGSIVMGNQSNNRILTNNTTLTQEAGHTVRGGGQLLADTGGMLNQGSIIADQSTALTIDPNALGFTNEGTLQTTGGGITLASGPFTNSGSVTIGAGSSLNRTGLYTQTGGGTTLMGGTLSASGTVDIQGGVLAGNGTISGTVSNAGDLSPGASAGTLNITGSYTQTPAGTFNVDIGGYSAGTEFDVVNVTGTASLDGTLNVALINGFVPIVGDTFEVMTFAGRNGEFANKTGLIQDNGIVFIARFTSNSLVLEVAPPDYYVGFKILPTKDIDGKRPKFPKDWVMTFDDVSLDNADADDPENYKIVRPLSLLNPAMKNVEEGPANPTLHYIRYRIKEGREGVGAALPTGKFPPATKHVRRQWELTNQFGTITVDSVKASALLLPANKELGGPAAPLTGNPTHFKCYKVKAAKDIVTDQTPSGQGRKFDNSIQAFFEDQFDDCGGDLSFDGSPVAGKCLYRFLRPVELCNPVIKSEVEPTRTTAATIDGSTPANTTPVLCYKISLATKFRSASAAALVGASVGDAITPRQSKHQPWENVSTAPANQFPVPVEVDTKRLQLLCTPTEILSVSVLP